MTSSEYLEFLTASGKNILHKEAILKIWLERLPPKISTLLDSKKTFENEKEMVDKADKIFN